MAQDFAIQKQALQLHYDVLRTQETCVRGIHTVRTIGITNYDQSKRSSSSRQIKRPFLLDITDQIVGCSSEQRNECVDVRVFRQEADAPIAE